MAAEAATGRSNMAQDLRSYLEQIKRRKPEDFKIVAKPVDPAYEITALVVKLEREAKQRPVLLFENVKGTKFPVLTNLHASRPRLAAAMGVAPEETQRAYLRAMEKPLAPKVVKTGPVKEVILTGQKINLYDLPQMVHHEGDAGPYLTAAISFAKDPTAEVWNCAYNRLMIKGRDTTSIHLTTGKHLWEFHRIAESRGEPLPVALVIGVHPAIALGALAIGSIDEDERYSLGERQREVVRVKAITHRRDAMFQDITVAHLDHLLLSTIPIEANLYRAVRAMVPSVKAVRVPGPFTCFVSIEQRVPGQAKNAIMAVLGADLYMKRVVVVDHDVTPAAPTSTPRRGRTATRQSGAWTRRPSPRSPPTRRATACRPRSGSGSTSRTSSRSGGGAELRQPSRGERGPLA
ncbi:MAG: UbiD family decarboxylase [Candidatus Rokubacteria bacterium]|nr:UbiD family decarboxylase [Candidatus Rokubacteria bacterium]